MIKRFLFLSSGFFLGVCANHYLEGWYKMIFEAAMWTGLIAVTIQIFKNRKRNGVNNEH